MSRIKNFIRNINYLTKHSLWDQREEDIVYLTNKILDDGLYEYDIDLPRKSHLMILNQEESLSQLETNPKSFIRTNDGEVRLIWNLDQPFQRYEKEVADRMLHLLQHHRDDIYVGINRGYFYPPKNQEEGAFNRRNAYEFRKFYIQNCCKDSTYLDATFTFYSFAAGKTSYYDAIFARWRNLFRDKKLVIICGEGILDHLEHDIFELAASKHFIYGPRRHAWDQHDQIIQRIQEEADKDSLLIFILGMAGKAMIPEVTDLGYMAWDIGHLAKSYNAYKTEMKPTRENIDKFFAPD